MSYVSCVSVFCSKTLHASTGGGGGVYQAPVAYEVNFVKKFSIFYFQFGVRTCFRSILGRYFLFLFEVLKNILYLSESRDKEKDLKVKEHVEAIVAIVSSFQRLLPASL